MRTAQYATELSNVPKILVAEDARLLMQRRATSSFHFSPAYFMSMLEREKLQSYEPRIISEFDAVTYVSDAERTYMMQFNPHVRAAVVTNGVDVDAFPFSSDHSRRKGIIFCGKMDVMHNVRMALRIGRDIYPALKKIYPGLLFTIAGKNPPRSVRALGVKDNDICVLGEVPRVQEYIQSAAVFVHPQEVGSGIQNKVLESMALGTPVVSTPVGISGIAARNGVHALITETNEECIAACAQLLSSEYERSRIAGNARALIEQNHTWGRVADQMQEVIDGVFQRRSAPMPITHDLEVAV